MAENGGFPKGLGVDEALRRFHFFYGHPDEIIAERQQERVLPVATDQITQFNPAVPDHDADPSARADRHRDLRPPWARSPPPKPSWQESEMTENADYFAAPNGLRTRGTVVIVAGRGQSRATYARFGRRLAADAHGCG